MPVVELLDDLRERIWAHYDLALFDLLRQDRVSPRQRQRQRLPAHLRPTDDSTEEPPF
jgi:hypothetical protein